MPNYIYTKNEFKYSTLVGYNKDTMNWNIDPRKFKNQFFYKKIL